MRSCPRLFRTALVLALLGSHLLPGPARAADDGATGCPPVAQPPSAEQLQATQRAARDRGFLWRIRKGGRTSYLYGTLHVGKLAWSMPGPRVREALMSTQSLALELDLMDDKILAQLAAAPAAADHGAALEMPAGWQSRVAQQVAAACLPPTALATQHPVMQAITLTVLAARWDGLDAAYAQEFVLGGFARAANKPVVSLESPAQQMAALLPADAARARTMAEQTLEQLEQGRARATLRRVARAWEQGDLDDLAQYERWCDCITSDEDAAHLRMLNDERNGPLAERIDALHAGGKTVFAAVGSLHMTGPQSLPRLMAQRGYSVERVRF